MPRSQTSQLFTPYGLRLFLSYQLNFYFLSSASHCYLLQ